MHDIFCLYQWRTCLYISSSDVISKGIKFLQLFPREPCFIFKMNLCHRDFSKRIRPMKSLSWPRESSLASSGSYICHLQEEPVDSGIFKRFPCHLNLGAGSSWRWHRFLLEITHVSLGDNAGSLWRWSRL